MFKKSDKMIAFLYNERFVVKTSRKLQQKKYDSSKMIRKINDNVYTIDL